MATPNFVQAYKGTVTIGGTQFAVLSVTYSEKAPLEDITYTKSGGATFGIQLPGYITASGTLSFVYDVANQPVLDPQNLKAGTLMVLVIYPEGTKPYSFSAYSSEFTFTTGPQAGVSVKCSCSWTSTDTITRPTS